MHEPHERELRRADRLQLALALAALALVVSGVIAQRERRTRERDEAASAAERPIGPGDAAPAARSTPAPPPSSAQTSSPRQPPHPAPSTPSASAHPSHSAPSPTAAPPHPRGASAKPSKPRSSGRPPSSADAAGRDAGPPAASSTAMAAIPPGLARHLDPRGGFTLDYPAEMKNVASPARAGSPEGGVLELWFRAPDGSADLVVYAEPHPSPRERLDALWEEARREDAGARRRVLTETRDENGFVVSGRVGDRIFHTKAAVGAGNVVHFTLAYDEAARAHFDSLVPAVEESLRVN
jgi:hypothetical protein